MVVRATEHRRENLYGGSSSSTYFKHLDPDNTTNPSQQIALSDRMDEWIAGQNVLIKVARGQQSKTDFHALVEYDPSITEYSVNSYVLFTPPVSRSDKLLPRHRGPYQVMDKTHSIYTIEDLVVAKLLL
jgi:hypothetical protein